MMQIPLGHILVLSSLLFSIGVLGVLLRRNAIVIFMSIELMLNAVNLSFVGFAQSMDSLNGVMFIFFIIVVAAVEPEPLDHADRAPRLIEPKCQRQSRQPTPCQQTNE